MVLTAVIIGFGFGFYFWDWLDVLFIEYDWLSDFTDLCRLLQCWSIIKESQCIRILRINISNNQSHYCKDYAYYLVLGLCVRDYVGQDGQKYHFHDCTNISSMITQFFHLIYCT